MKITVNFFVLIILCLPFACMSGEPDWDEYNLLLEKYVTGEEKYGVKLNWVDYSSLVNEPLFKKLIKSIESFHTEKLENKNEIISFYINIYNILAIKAILDHWPVKNIRDVGSIFKPVWKKPVGKINKKNITLHEIEHEILRKMGEPRIHMAIVCASVSCPDLRKQAYTANELNQQLEEQTLKFLKNPNKGLRIENDAIVVSKIFNWFGKDFKTMGGVTGFIRNYLELPSKEFRLEYMSYDWRLNGN